jgi:hypothetical protein
MKLCIDALYKTVPFDNVASLSTMLFKCASIIEDTSKSAANRLEASRLRSFAHRLETFNQTKIKKLRKEAGAIVEARISKYTVAPVVRDE